jgi:DNA replication protein DnaC
MAALSASVAAPLSDEQRARRVAHRAAYDAKVEAERAREEAEAKAKADERAALPGKLAARTDRRIMSAIRQGSPCILILGPTGVGKTSAMRWLQLQHRGTWFSARELAACERRHSLGEGEPPDLARACSSELLYLDDLGTEDGRDNPVLKHVIDRRYSSGYPTVLNTGLTKAMLTERYEAPTERRLLEQHLRRSDGSEWPVIVVDCHA